MSEPPPPAQPKPSATPPPVGLALSRALRAALVDPEHWRESLDAYASTTNLAVVMVDTAGQPCGPCLNPRPTWQWIHAHQQAAAAPQRSAPLSGRSPRCPFTLAPSPPCTCVGDAVAQRTLILRRDRTGLVHFTVPLLLDDDPVGALLAGQVFDQYPEQLVLEHVAKRLGGAPDALWQVARLEVPVRQATLRVYGRLLAALGQAVLHARYHTLLDAQRFEALEQRFQERTAALHHESAERQRLEHEAQRAQHFALLGRLAAGVSHEIRNPLAAIFLHVDVLTEELQQLTPGSPAVVTETLAEIRTQLGRLEDLVQDYLSLVRVATIELMPEDLGRAVQAWATEFYPLAAHQGISLQAEGLAELGFVALHTTTFRRAVLNLVQNALDAMPQGGTLTLTGRRMPMDVQLQIQDTGSGISHEQRAKIFEPLYTTKPGGDWFGLIHRPGNSRGARGADDGRECRGRGHFFYSHPAASGGRGRRDAVERSTNPWTQRLVLLQSR